MKRPVDNALAGRVEAVNTIWRWLRTGDFPDRLLNGGNPLSLELVYGAVRNRRAIEWVIGKFVRKAPRDKELAALMVGVWQLLFSGIPEYAAIDTTTEAARCVRIPHGFVNAVLRNVLRNRDALRGELAGLPLAVRESHPDEIVARWIRQFGPEEAERICRVDNAPADVVCVSMADGEVPRNDELYTIHPTEPRAVVMRHGRSVVDLPGFGDGEWTVQDVATLSAVDLVDARPGDVVLDACAAPGGKAMQLARRLRGEGRVVAMDLHEDRLARLRENVARLRVADVVDVVCGDAANLPPELAGRGISKILADVPCSNTGVFRRRIDARWRFSEKRLVELAETQFRILDSLSALRPERIVYSTCSLECEEDEAVVERFAKAHPEYEVAKSVKSMPDLTPRDGAYAALLKMR